jgi:hypothetical protein
MTSAVVFRASMETNTAAEVEGLSMGLARPDYRYLADRVVTAS